MRDLFSSELRDGWMLGGHGLEAIQQRLCALGSDAEQVDRVVVRVRVSIHRNAKCIARTMKDMTGTLPTVPLSDAECCLDWKRVCRKTPKNPINSAQATDSAVPVAVAHSLESRCRADCPR